MIHRAMLGSLERFLGVYIEHCAGAFPTWLAPVQVIVIGISEHQTDYVNQIAEQLSQAGYRVETDVRNEKVGYKIREAETMKIPFMAVAGAREMESGGVSVRRHGQGDLGSMTVNGFIQSIDADVKQGMSTH
jgi:threonyl-tRNA synthetase